MRGRDGNNALLLRLCTVIIFIFFYTLSASEYHVSYRYIVKDLVLFNETLLVSQAMTKCKGKPQEALVLEDESGDFKKTVAKNSHEFIDFIHKIGLHAEHRETTINSLNSALTILTLKTTCFKVDFNDNFVKIAPLK